MKVGDAVGVGREEVLTVVADCIDQGQKVEEFQK